MRWVACTLLVLSTGCDVILSLKYVEASPLHRKTITIAPQQLGAPLTNMQISVWLQNDDDIATYASDASFISFTDTTGAPLACEIASYAAGTLDAWVLLPSIPASGIAIELEYGAVAQPCNDANVWPTGLLGVWHEPDGQGVFHDKSLHHHDATELSSADAPAVVLGIAGNGASYDGVGDSACVAQTGDDNSLDFGKGAFSFSAWVNVTQSAGIFDEPLSKGGESMAEPGFLFALGSGAWQVHLSDGVVTTTLAGKLSDAPLTGWAQLVGAVDRPVNNLLTVYANGSLRDSMPIPAAFGSVTNQNRTLCLGGPNEVFKGVLDEPRVYSYAISTDRVAIEYANLANRAQFMTIGDDELVN